MFQLKELCKILGFGLHERCLRGAVRRRGLRGAGKAVWVRVWGVWFVSSEWYLQVSVFVAITVNVREDMCDDLTFRRCPRGVG